MSSGYNQAVVLGRLTEHPEELRTRNGTIFIKATIEVLAHRKTARSTTGNEKRLVVATLFGSAAELFLKHVRVGDLVHLAGLLDAKEWEHSDGTKRFALAFIVEHVSLLPNARKGAE